MKKSLIGKLTAAAVAATMLLSTGAAAFGAAYIGESAAVSKALKNAGASRSQVWELECEKDKDNGITVYDVEFKKGSTEYSYKINAKTGNIREKTVEYRYRYSSAGLIGKTAAINRALSFCGIPKTAITELTCRYDYDDGKEIYEVKFKKGNYRYDHGWQNSRSRL